ncbi:lysozyme [Coralloluteibacterium thermophilus]|uniref:Lysozyme n=1 Tax=Coralloluteibacterium thermophilum TaxID=2707049 RepID=A0ABV9NNT9_9GAMM
MITSDAGVALIKRHEGWRPRVYNDPAGYATVGYGHLIAKRPATAEELARAPLTEAEGNLLLREDLTQAEWAVTDLVKVPLTQNQFDALVSFVFNVGRGNFQGSTLLRKLNAGDYAGAANEFGRWVYAGGKVLSGLVRRREDERRLFLS